MNTEKEVRTIETWKALKKRRTWAKADKLKMIAETRETGKSVSLVAYLNYLPPAQLHKWVKQFGGQS